MRLKFFTIPAFGGRDAAEEFDRFLASHRIIAIDREFVQDGRGSAWAFCVSYDEPGERNASISRRGTKVDYKEVLSEREFEVYARLREMRKQLAEKEGIPAYAVFKNEQLAAMVKGGIDSLSALGEIPGVGTARAAKYGRPFLALIAEFSAGRNDTQSHDHPDAPL